jgi:dihydroceramidase
MHRTAGTVLLTVLLTTATLALLSIVGPDWTQFLPATCLATHCFCELPRAGALVLQPANSWSSLGFVVVGCWIMFGRRRAADETAFAGWPALWFGLTAVVIGVGSFLLHATLTLWGQFYDVLGMYLLSGFMLAYAVQRWRGLSNGAAFALYASIVAFLVSLLWIMPETRRWLFAIALVLAIAAELAFARPRRPGVRAALFGYGLLANTVAFAIWILDNTLTFCAPDSLLQGHAIWHLLGATAVYLSYLYYRSERPAAGHRAASDVFERKG